MTFLNPLLEHTDELIQFLDRQIQVRELFEHQNGEIVSLLDMAYSLHLVKNRKLAKKVRIHKIALEQAVEVCSRYEQLDFEKELFSSFLNAV